MDSHLLVWPLELRIWTPMLHCGPQYVLFVRSFCSFRLPNINLHTLLSTKSSIYAVIYDVFFAWSDVS